MIFQTAPEEEEIETARWDPESRRIIFADAAPAPVEPEPEPPQGAPPLRPSRFRPATAQPPVLLLWPHYCGRHSDRLRPNRLGRPRFRRRAHSCACPLTIIVFVVSIIG